VGKDDREASSPSFFNIDEVLQVKSYVRQLKASGKFRTGEWSTRHDLSNANTDTPQ
jgi:helicase MOV-10